MTTPRIEEILSNIEDIIENYHGIWPDEDEMGEILGEVRKAHQAGYDAGVADGMRGKALQDNKYKIN